MGLELWGFAGEIAENGLGDVFGQGGIVGQLTQGGGIDEVEVALDQFSEGRFGVTGQVLPY